MNNRFSVTAALAIVVVVGFAAVSYAQCTGPNCRLAGFGAYSAPSYYQPVQNCPTCQQVPYNCSTCQQVPKKLTLLPQKTKKATPMPISAELPPLPTDAEIPKYDFSSYGGAVEAAIADLKWRQDKHAIWVACEEDARDRLLLANKMVDGIPPIFGFADLSERGVVSGDVLKDAQFRLEAAAAISKKFALSELTDRFVAEACWVSKWRGIAEMHPMPPQSQRHLWERIATVWGRNAEAISAEILDEQRIEPYCSLMEKLSPEAAQAIQSGSVWSDVFGVDQYYTLVETASPNSWFFFKVIPPEYFKGEEQAPKEVVPHRDLQEKVHDLADLISRK